MLYLKISNITFRITALLKKNYGGTITLGKSLCTTPPHCSPRARLNLVFILDGIYIVISSWPSVVRNTKSPYNTHLYRLDFIILYRLVRKRHYSIVRNFGISYNKYAYLVIFYRRLHRRHYIIL